MLPIAQMLNYFLGVSLVVFSEIFDSRIVFYVVSTHARHTHHTRDTHIVESLF